MGYLGRAGDSKLKCSIKSKPSGQSNTRMAMQKEGEEREKKKA
jgi:hypothetical protein